MSPSLSSPSPSALRSRVVFLWVAITGAILLFQTFTGVWTSDIGADPDEPAHAVTSLMVRDYLASGFSQSPLTFAQRYYEDFPKVALGHYPPGYYALAGIALLPWPRPQVLLALQAVLIGLLSVQVYLLGRLMLRDTSAWVAGALVACFPVTLKLSQLIMADLLLTCFCLLAVEFWARFLEKPRVSLALLFGVTAAAAILTKGSGLALALVPAVSVLMLGRWELLKKPSFWVAGASVALLAGPWMLYSSKITKEGMVSTGALDYAWRGVKFYASSLSYTFGYAAFVLSCLGLLFWLMRKDRREGADVRQTALLGLVVGTLLIMLLIPTGYSARYFMPMVPVVALLAVTLLDQWATQPVTYRGSLIILVLLVCLQFPVRGFPIKDVSGYRQAVSASLADLPADPKEHWLVCGDPRGEGAVIASAAFDFPQRTASQLRVHRGSKELASTDWLGRDYKPAFSTPEALLAYLDQTKISRIFVDQTSPEEKTSVHSQALLEAIGHHEQWKLEREQPTTRPYQTLPGTLRVYRRVKG